MIAIEDLNIKGLAAGMLSKSVHDVGWSSFFAMLSCKAESAGRQLIKVDPRGTSQRCCRCQTEVRKELKDRWHECPACHLSIHRDLNSAVEILRLGLSLAGITWDTSSCVLAEAPNGEWSRTRPGQCRCRLCQRLAAVHLPPLASLPR